MARGDILAKKRPAQSLPIRRDQFDTQDFLAWLVTQGAEIGTPTNPYEVVRYRAYVKGGRKAATHIVYAKENGLLTWCGAAKQHYEVFCGKRPAPSQEADVSYRQLLDGAVAKAKANIGGPPKGWLKPERKTGPLIGKAQKIPAPSSREQKVLALLRRDGDCCWFCDRPLEDDKTIEHLVPKSNGGRNILENYALAHEACNRRAANLPLVKKIELRAIMRADSGQLVGDA